MRPRLTVACAVGVVFACVPGIAVAAPWSAAQDLGPPAGYVRASGVAVLGSGSALLGWTTRSQPAGAGGLPGAISVTADPNTNDGERGVVGVVAPDGSARVATRRGWSLIAGPVTGGGGGAVALASRVVDGDEDGNRYVRLYLVRLGAAGDVLATRRLVRHAVVRSADIAGNARGEAVVAWVQARPFVPGRGESGPHAFQELHALRAAAVTPAGRVGAVRTLQRTWSYKVDYGGQVTAAVGHDGRALVGMVSGHGGRRGRRSVDAFVRRPGQRFSAARRVGPQSGFGELAAAFTSSGRAVIAWGTQDGGEEAGQPWVVRAATISPALRRWTRPQILDPGQVADRPVGGLAAAGLTDGTVAVAWSAVTAGRPYVAHPVRVTVSSHEGRFGPSSTLAPDGAVGSLAAARDGRLLLTWSTTPDYATPGVVPRTQAMAALRPPGAASFGTPEPLADPDVASPPLAAFLPDGRAVAIWAARPNGQDPSQGVGTTSVLRTAVRATD
jgi:hypothetical protein